MSGAVIVDASVAVKWFVPESRSAEADALAAAGLSLLAPSFLVTEVASALAKKARAGLITGAHAVECTSLLPRYINELIETERLVPLAIQASVEIDHALYDCLYLTVARSRGAVVVTDDRKLLGKLSDSSWAGYAVALDSWTSALT